MTVKPTYRSVAGRIRQELPALKRVTLRAISAFEEGLRTGDDRFFDSAALNLHAYYSGVEQLFEQIAKRIDGSVPEGPGWHVDLLGQMASSIAEVRPPVISSDVQAQLDRYRGFRHVVRNVYTFNLDSQQMKSLVDDLPRAFEVLQAALEKFADLLDAVASED